MTRWWNFGNLDFDDDDDNESSGFYTGSSYYGKKYTSSLGWSRNKLTDTSSYYSSWGGSIFNTKSSTSTSEDKSKLILLTKVYKAVRDMVVILDFPFEVIVSLSNSSRVWRSSKGKGKTRTIYVPSSIIDDTAYTDDEKINILCGLGIHEASHLKYTELRTYNTFSKSARRETKYFANLIEDARVEDVLLSERPGYLNFIEDSIKYRYEQLQKKIEILPTHIPEDILKFLLNVIKFIRYPDKVDPDVITDIKYESYFRRLKDIISQNNQFTKDSCIAGDKVYNLLVEMFSDLQYDLDYISDFLSDVQPDNSFEVRCGFDKSVNGLCPSEVSKLFNESSRSNLYEDIICGSVELGEMNDVYIEKPEGDPFIYRDIKKEISKYIPGIKKLIQGTDKNYDFTIHGCREGLLDTSKLAEAYQGVPQVYIKKGKVSTNKTTVCVLIDQSGSMYGPKMNLARQAAILLNESLKDLPGIDLYIYGHSADEKLNGDTIIYSYREGNKYKPQYALSEAKAHSNNRDGLAILEVAKRIRKQTDDDCIMFVLSDGEPAACYYGGYNAILDVKNKVNTVEKMGFTVIQVSIDFVHRAREMFSNVISLEYDLANFPKRLSQVIKKAIVRNKQTTVS